MIVWMRLCEGCNQAILSAGCRVSGCGLRLECHPVVSMWHICRGYHISTRTPGERIFRAGVCISGILADQRTNWAQCNWGHDFDFTSPETWLSKTPLCEFDVFSVRGVSACMRMYTSGCVTGQQCVFVECGCMHNPSLV